MADFKTGLEAAQRGDFALAISEWTALAEKGDGAAQYNLAVLYDKGRGTAQDYKQAAHWYRKAAEQQFIWAQYAMGSLYERGQGVPLDPAVAADWYARAATNKFPRAMNDLARLYEQGLGVKQNKVAAYALAKLSMKTDPAQTNPAQQTLQQLVNALSAQELQAGKRLFEEISLPGNLRNALDQLNASAK